MHQIEITYTRNLRTQCNHLQSGDKIITDAPVDNYGNGEAFSPTDLAVTALGSCLLTIMGIAAKTHGINIDQSIARVTKIMSKNPRRIGKIIIDIKKDAGKKIQGPYGVWHDIPDRADIKINTMRKRVIETIEIK